MRFPFLLLLYSSCVCLLCPEFFIFGVIGSLQRQRQSSHVFRPPLMDPQPSPATTSPGSEEAYRIRAPPSAAAGSRSSSSSRPSDPFQFQTLSENPFADPYVHVKAGKPRPRWLHTATLLDEYMFVFGGRKTDDPRLFNDLWLYNVAENRWVNLEPSGLPPLTGSDVDGSKEGSAGVDGPVFRAGLPPQPDVIQPPKRNSIPSSPSSLAGQFGGVRKSATEEAQRQRKGFDIPVQELSPLHAHSNALLEFSDDSQGSEDESPEGGLTAFQVAVPPGEVRDGQGQKIRFKTTEGKERKG